LSKLANIDGPSPSRSAKDTAGLSKSENFGNNRSVSFGTVRVRTHKVCLVDNPAVSTGPPLELEWDCFASECFQLDEYEDLGDKSPPKRISIRSREEMLSQRGHSRASFVRVDQEIREIKAGRRQIKKDDIRAHQLDEYKLMASTSLKDLRNARRTLREEKAANTAKKEPAERTSRSLSPVPSKSIKSMFSRWTKKSL
jgi:hypothetical protein